MDETERLDDAEKQRFRELLREQQAFRLQAKNVRWRNPDIDREEMLRRQQQEGFGTELDKVNCAFFLKTGACRYGETCSKQHPYPSSSNTLLFTNMYHGPGLKELGDDFALELTEKDIYDAFYKFWDDVVPEFEKYGEIEALRVCRNHSQHLRGNVLVKYFSTLDCHHFLCDFWYRRLEDAERAKAALNGRSYDGRRLMIQFVAVENFSAAICGMFNRNECDRGRECNFLHVFRNPGHKYEERDDDHRRSRDRSPPRRALDDREGRNYRDDRRRDSRHDDLHRRDEPRREDSRRDDRRRDEPRRDDRREEPRRDDRDRRDERRDESRRDDDRRESRRDDRDRDRHRDHDDRDRHRDRDDRDRHRDHDDRDRERDRKRGRSPAREEHETDAKKPRVDAD